MQLEEEKYIIDEDSLRSKLHTHVLIPRAVIRAPLDRKVLSGPLLGAEGPRIGIVGLAASV